MGIRESQVEVEAMKMARTWFEATGCEYVTEAQAKLLPLRLRHSRVVGDRVRWVNPVCWVMLERGRDGKNE